MTFFNKKEEVVQLELTRLGRQKLAMGEFKPAYYEFLDDDILYDRRNFVSGSYEDQNEIKRRIKEKLSFRSVTAKQSVPANDKAYKPENRQVESMGTFLPYSNYKPAWKIVAEDGTLFTGSGDIDYTPLEAVSGSGLTVGPSYEKIPQLNLVCEYSYNLGIVLSREDVVFQEKIDLNPYLTEEDLLKNKSDDTYILFKKDFNDFTISIEEENVLNGKDDFVLEFFKYDYTQDENGNEKVEMNQLFIDDENIDQNSAYWYFDITTDDLVEPAREGLTFTDEPVALEPVDNECVDV